MTEPGGHDNIPLPLAQRYGSADPIDWCGAPVYPMYTEAMSLGTTVVRLQALSASAPGELTGMGVGLQVLDGHLSLGGKRLAGVDIWYDALASGIEIELTADAPEAMFTVTPVWVGESGAQESWTGNYGVVVDLLPGQPSTLWCSTGVGDPDFNELVVELATEYLGGGADADTTRLPVPVVAPAPAAPSPAVVRPPDDADVPLTAGPGGVGRALHDLGTAMHERGDHDSARSLWTQAAQAGHPGAAYDLGALLLRSGDHGAAEHWWRAAAPSDPRAAAALADLRGGTRPA
ncbi:tetratricopeptide repeat protein [Nocardia thailandica]|uniref:tetratricopeptide repeat protein n=1 Tax=Nocardia thailandica TaxID=257275 RepID=UPI0002DBA9DD|nr:tetratricopeptide repeat protein [Nocardia thailandica]